MLCSCVQQAGLLESRSMSPAQRKFASTSVGSNTNYGVICSTSVVTTVDGVTLFFGPGGLGCGPSTTPTGIGDSVPGRDLA